MTGNGKTELELQPKKVWERNLLRLEPEDMRKWLVQSPEDIREQLLAVGNMYATLRSYTVSAYEGLCEAASEANPANYAAKMVSGLLQDYQNPTKQSEMKKAGVNEFFITMLIEAAKRSHLINDDKKPLVDEHIAAELQTSISAVQPAKQQQDGPEKSSVMPTDILLELNKNER